MFLMKTLTFRPAEKYADSACLRGEGENYEANSYITVQRDCAGNYSGSIVRKSDRKE